MRPRAFCLIRTQPAYRRDSFAAGLKAVGYDVHFHAPTQYRAGDVLVVWNRYGQNDAYARRMKEAGGTVLVAENGYLGRDWRGGHWYALAQDRHNGVGTWPDGGLHRWRSWGVELAPWKDNRDGHVLVLLQRGIGVAPVAQPGGWECELRADLPRMTGRRIVWRGHPGERHPHETLYRDLAGAWCVVTWGSGAALKALVEGVPVFYGLHRWIGAGAGRLYGENLEHPLRSDTARRAMFGRLAWAMWNTDELASGEAFECLLKTTSRAA